MKVTISLGFQSVVLVIDAVDCTHTSDGDLYISSNWYVPTL